MCIKGVKNIQFNGQIKDQLVGLVENDYKTNLSKMIECEDNGTFTSLSFSKKPKLNHK